MNCCLIFGTVFWDSSQDETLAKEAAKIAHKRQIFEERRRRIHDHKQRTIGLDIPALDAQVAEKKKNSQRDHDVLMFERKSIRFGTFAVCLN
jgi:hypothetical protein